MMRPTLIQQKPVFGQEPGARVEQARPFSIALYFYVIVGSAWLFATVCSQQLLACGVAHGLGHLECKNLQYLLRGVFGFLFLFLIFGPKAKGGTWKRPTDVPWVGLMGIAALLVGIYFLPQFVTRNRRPWLIPGPAPAALSGPEGLPIMTGTWEGRFDHRPALLAVTHQNNESFVGELLVRAPGYTYKIAVEGTLDRSGTINIEENQVLDEAFYHDWALGTDTGTDELSAPEMQGRGVDTRGSRYHWGFEHVSSAVYIPEN